MTTGQNDLQRVQVIISRTTCRKRGLIEGNFGDLQFDGIPVSRIFGTGSRLVKEAKEQTQLADELDMMLLGSLNIISQIIVSAHHR
ncbi:MAG: hypothetical protein CM1200mP18_06660 [Gammaproteobacteria bacterium]|nr:MAG: hypothetical protein CM1200mP18_06660 [Gammaproteobacteria bacterium]